MLAACLSALALLLAIAGGLFTELRYWLVLAAVICSFSSTLPLVRMLVGRLWAIQLSLNSVPIQIAQHLPSELHAMEVLLERFPQCSIPTSSWSMRFANLLTILDLLDTHRPELVVEFGSGISTLLVAAWMKKAGRGTIVSFDHDEQWACITRRHLVRQDLKGHATVVDAPLARTASFGLTSDWYDLGSQLEHLSEIDLVIVDGPPAGISDKRLSRLPALDKLQLKLAPSCCVVLDDALRPGELEVVNRWVAAFPKFSARMLNSDTGMAILTRSSQGSLKTGTACGACTSS